MGHRPFREAVARYLRTARAVRCEADQIMVVSGSQQALSLIARVLVDPGSPVWVEEPGYGGARDVLRLRSARLVPVPVDEEGLIVSAGTEKCPDADGGLRDPLPSIPAGHGHERLAPSATAGLGAPERLLDHRRRLRQRVPVREPSDRFAAGTRRGRAGHLRRDLQQGPLPRAAPRLPRPPRRSRRPFRRRPRRDGHLPADLRAGGPRRLHPGGPFRPSPSEDAGALSGEARCPRRRAPHRARRRRDRARRRSRHAPGREPHEGTRRRLRRRAFERRGRGSGRCRFRPATSHARRAGASSSVSAARACRKFAAAFAGSAPRSGGDEAGP